MSVRRTASHKSKHRFKQSLFAQSELVTEGVKGLILLF